MDRLPSPRNNGGGYDPLERLAQLRQCWPTSRTVLAKPGWHSPARAITRGKFAENVRFSYGGVVFIGLNAGQQQQSALSDKECTHKSARTLAQCQGGNAEYAERDAANIDWLRSVCSRPASSMRPVVVFFQADPGFDLPETEDVDESTCRSTGLSCPDAGTDRADRAVRWPGIASAR